MRSHSYSAVFYWSTPMLDCTSLVVDNLNRCESTPDPEPKRIIPPNSSHVPPFCHEEQHRLKLKPREVLDRHVDPERGEARADSDDQNEHPLQEDVLGALGWGAGPPVVFIHLGLCDPVCGTIPRTSDSDLDADTDSDSDTNSGSGSGSDSKCRHFMLCLVAGCIRGTTASRGCQRRG